MHRSHAPPLAWKPRLCKFLLTTMLTMLPWLLWATEALARRRRSSNINVDDTFTSNPFTLVVVVTLLGLIPFALTMITSFVKIAVVLSIVRSALGTQQNPPTQVITGLAIILTVYVMVPVGLEIQDEIRPLMTSSSRNQKIVSKATVEIMIKAALKAREPVRRFLIKHSHNKDRYMFYNLALQLRKDKYRKQLTPNDLTVVIPAFVISELKEAFQIGFLLFLPFIVVDMVVANILLALGMHMLSPTTISLPFKLLLFVLVDGWYLIIKGLILGYV
ncbi:MAG: type III secretion system export apparatus subunit SctR [Myxococcota bacterium]